jgi:Arc/MetJ-type ribon-helix-helix transcriptional regulator
MDKKKWASITIPAALVDQVRPQVEKGNYQSIAEFVKESVRLRLEQLKASQAIQGLEAMPLEQ